MIRANFSTYNGTANGGRSIEEAIAEVTRELDVRKRLYDKWVSENRISWVDANDRLERLISALKYLVIAESELVQSSAGPGQPPWIDETSRLERGGTSYLDGSGNHKVSPF